MKKQFIAVVLLCLVSTVTWAMHYDLFFARGAYMGDVQLLTMMLNRGVNVDVRVAGGDGGHHHHDAGLNNGDASDDSSHNNAGENTNKKDSKHEEMESENELDAYGVSPGATGLMWAAKGARIAVMRFLLQHEADINAHAEDGTTPLIWAAKDGKIKSISLLYASGADMHLQDKDGLTALAWAKKNHHVKAAELIMLLGASK